LGLSQKVRDQFGGNNRKPGMSCHALCLKPGDSLGSGPVAFSPFWDSAAAAKMVNRRILHHSWPQIRTDFFDPIQSFNNMYEMERMTSHPDHFEM